MAELREWCPKMLREQLCNQQTFAPDAFTRGEIQRLINVLDLHRPLAPNGKHGDLHTPTCGCEDKPGPVGGDDTPQPATVTVVLEDLRQVIKRAHDAGDNSNALDRIGDAIALATMRAAGSVSGDPAKPWCTYCGGEHLIESCSDYNTDMGEPGTEDSPGLSGDRPTWRHLRLMEPHPVKIKPGSEHPARHREGQMEAVCETCGEAVWCRPETAESETPGV